MYRFATVLSHVQASSRYFWDMELRNWKGGKQAIRMVFLRCMCGEIWFVGSRKIGDMLAEFRLAYDARQLPGSELGTRI